MCYLIAKDRDAHGCYALKTSVEISVTQIETALPGRRQGGFCLYMQQ